MIKHAIENSIAVKSRILEDPEFIEKIEKAAQLMIDAYRKQQKVLFCGNGGSAADAQHLAAELSGRFYYDRPPLSAEAMHVNTSYLTAVANDYSYNEVYARYLNAVGKSGDVLVAFSTSGNSPNIIRAIEEAQKMNIRTIAFTGETGGKMRDMADILINVPSKDTPRIQEAHIMIGHILCEMVEAALFPKG